MASRYSPLDPQPLARTLLVWLWLDLALTVAIVPLALFQISRLQAYAPTTPVSSTESLPGMELADGLYALFALPYLVVLLTAAFLSLKWIYRVSRNAHALAPGLEIRPPWAVGWYFVPFANFWMPFRALREAWQASSNPEHWRGAPVPAVMRWWWGLWLLSGFIEQVSFRVGLQATTVGAQINSELFTVISAIVAVPLNLVFIRLVRQLTDRQASTLQREAFA